MFKCDVREQNFLSKLDLQGSGSLRALAAGPRTVMEESSY